MHLVEAPRTSRAHAFCTQNSNMERDPLEFLPQSDWPMMEEEFKTDWPRSAQAYNALKTQRKWIALGLHYGFKVYCPHGDVKNGMVAINEKQSFYEVIIQCAREDIKVLEDALRRTKVIDWNKSSIVVPFAPQHIKDCLKRNLSNFPVESEKLIPSCSFIYNKEKPPHEIKLPKNYRFGLLTQEHVSLVNDVWPHSYTNSEWFFTQLIKANQGYALYVDDGLVCWGFIYEVGTLGHLYTLEEHRRKGYGELMLKLITNELLSRNEDILAFTLTGNVRSIELFTKMGFEEYGRTYWCYMHTSSGQH